jgi:hypothetical protein
VADDVNSQSLAESWTELLAAFRDEADRFPTNAELAELLTWAFRSIADGIPDLPPSPTVQSAVNVRGRSVVPELNDVAFEHATALVTDAISLLAPVTGPPSAQSVLDLLANALPLAARASEIRGAGGWRLRPGRARIRVRIGDVVAIPLARGKYRYVLVVARTRFGWAFGVLEGIHALRPSGPLRPAAVRPVYAGTERIADGQWPIVGHDEGLLDALDRDPEIYHEPRPHPLIGPYGSAERAGGAMRHLSEEEAREVGLLDRTYVVAFMPNELVAWLRRLER